METMKWLMEHSWKMVKILAVIFVAVFILGLLLPRSYLLWLRDKLAFAEIVLPAPRQTPYATMKTVNVAEDELHRNGFATLVTSISILPNASIKQDDVIYGYARTDLFDKSNGTMWFVVRRTDGVPVATGQAYTTYYTGGFGFVPFSLRVPYLLVSGDCLLEFRREDPKKGMLKDILFTSMPVTCSATTFK